MAGIPDLEELVGRCWHRWAAAAGSYARYPEAAVSFEEVRARLAVFYRGLGGPGGVRLTAAGAGASGHRLNLRQRLGLGDEESLERACLDDESLTLPARVDVFAERRLNERLYFWLAAFFAHAHPPQTRCDTPFQRDLMCLRTSHRATAAALQAWPGLREDHGRLARAIAAARPRRRLPDSEAAVEEVVIHLLDARPPTSELGERVLAWVLGSEPLPPDWPAARGYRPFLPVPLWGEVTERASGVEPEPEEAGAGGATDGPDRRLQARRRRCDESERRDSLVLNRFESILALAQMLNINRNVEDDDPDSARQAADAMDEVVVSGHPHQAATRLKLDLELAPPQADSRALQGERTYPEWDYRREAYHPDHCRVLAEVAGHAGSDWRPDTATRRRIRQVRRRFEALRPQRVTYYSQPDGEDLDLNALVRNYADLHGRGAGSDRVYAQTRRADRDLAVAVLLDASLSTDSWVDNQRVLDVEKEAVLALSHGLDACGDEHAVYTFSSRTRRRVNVHTIKGFDEPLGPVPIARLQALTPGYYTRIGAALRHTAAQLRQRPRRHRLLLLLTDGKPNDVDHYEGRYGVEDTRRAIRELRNSGLSVFGITVDSKAREYFPSLFGRGGYAIVPRIHRLPAALPAIIRQVIR